MTDSSLSLSRRSFLPHIRILKALCQQLDRLTYGRLSLTLPDNTTLEFGPQDHSLHAHIMLKNYRPLSKLMINGDIAFAECYMAGDWDTPDLTSLFEVAARNHKAFKLDKRGNWLSRALHRLRHSLNDNSKRGSKRNIAYHYDLGNDFYAQWLDETMTYSSALFDDKHTDLVSAQKHKYHTIAQMAGLKAGQSVLEIGCGWGGFSQIAAQDYDCKIHGLTLSSQQLAYAQKRYHDQGIAHKASASLTDYRDSKGTYDAIVSIEMFEAVGEDHWDAYFDTLNQRLKPDGTAVLQIITIEDDRFLSYRRNVDFIQRYIFPGGLLPSVSALKDRLEAHGFTLDDSHMFGQSYAETCALWQKNFQHAWDQIKPMGFDTRFKRMWEYYLSYCEAGFKAGTIDVGLFKLKKIA